MPVARSMVERFWNFWAAMYAPQSRPQHSDPGSIRRSIGLARGRLLRVGGGTRVRVETGAVWITWESGLEVCLKAGEGCLIEKGGGTLVSSIGVPRALVTVEPAMAAEPSGLCPADDTFTLQKLREIRYRAGVERALYFGNLFKAMLEACKRIVVWQAELRRPVPADSRTSMSAGGA